MYDITEAPGTPYTACLGTARVPFNCPDEEPCSPPSWAQAGGVLEAGVGHSGRRRDGCRAVKRLGGHPAFVLPTHPVFFWKNHINHPGLCHSLVPPVPASF